MGSTEVSGLGGATLMAKAANVRWGGLGKLGGSVLNCWKVFPTKTHTGFWDVHVPFFSECQLLESLFTKTQGFLGMFMSPFSWGGVYILDLQGLVK